MKSLWRYIAETFKGLNRLLHTTPRQMDDENKCFTFPILKVDHPMESGRIYPKDLVTRTIQDANLTHQDRLPVTLYYENRNGGAIPLDQIAGFAKNLRLEGDLVFADICTTTTVPGMELQRRLDHGDDGRISFRTVGLVRYTPGSRTVREFTITNLAALSSNRVTVF